MKVNRVIRDVFVRLQAAKETVKHSPTDVLTGTAVSREPALGWQQKHAERMESCARMMQSGFSMPTLSGRIGDCCDEDSAQVRCNLAPEPTMYEYNFTLGTHHSPVVLQ